MSTDRSKIGPIAARRRSISLFYAGVTATSLPCPIAHVYPVLNDIDLTLILNRKSSANDLTLGALLELVIDCDVFSSITKVLELLRGRPSKSVILLHSCLTEMGVEMRCGCKLLPPLVNEVHDALLPLCTAIKNSGCSDLTVPLLSIIIAAALNAEGNPALMHLLNKSDGDQRK